MSNSIAFEPIGAERIKAVLDTMGLKPDEYIEHTLVTKSMARARAKIESMVSFEIKTKSESEWFLKNVKKWQDDFNYYSWGLNYDKV